MADLLSWSSHSPWNRWISRGSTDVPRDQAACTILVLDPPGWPKSSPLSACDEGDDVGSFQRRDDCRPRLDRIPFQGGTCLGRLVLFCPALQLSCLSVSVDFLPARLFFWQWLLSFLSVLSDCLVARGRASAGSSSTSCMYHVGLFSSLGIAAYVPCQSFRDYPDCMLLLLLLLLLLLQR